MCTVSHGASTSRCERRCFSRCLSNYRKRFNDAIVGAARRTGIEAGLLRQVLFAPHRRTAYAHEETAAVQRRDRGRTSLRSLVDYFAASNHCF